MPTAVEFNRPVESKCPPRFSRARLWRHCAPPQAHRAHSVLASTFEGALPEPAAGEWFMQFGLSASERALQESARAFAREFIAPRAAEVDRSGEYPRDIVTALAKAGFCGMTIPEAYGGKGLSYLDAVLVIEEMAKACTVTARIVVETNMGAISTIMHYGSEEQRRLAAGLVLAGDKPAICITEPDAGSDTTAMSTRADKRG